VGRVHRLQVRFADTDAQGHVFFANHLTFFDEALSAYFRELGFPWQRLLELGVDLVYAGAQVSFEGRATFEDVLEIEVNKVTIGNTSITSSLIAKKEDGARISRGELVSVCVDRSTMKPVRVPDLIREAVVRSFG
jgi:acyl-CoA thioester hydrolase